MFQCSLSSKVRFQFQSASLKKVPAVQVLLLVPGETVPIVHVAGSGSVFGYPDALCAHVRALST